MVEKSARKLVAMSVLEKKKMNYEDENRRALRKTGDLDNQGWRGRFAIVDTLQ